MSHLLEMPDVVMKTIFEKLDFIDIQILRKTCHDLRNFIDDVKPDPKISRIKIFVESKEINIQIDSDLNLTYRTYQNQNSVVRHGKNVEKILEKKFMTSFCQDFEVILKKQKSIIEQFQIAFKYYSGYYEDIFLDGFAETFLENLKICLKFLRLKVKNFVIMAADQSQILPFLSNFDSKSIEKIEILNAKCGQNRILEIDEMMKFGIWKNAKILKLSNFPVLAGIRNFLHFDDVAIFVRDLSLEDFEMAKETLLLSPNFKKFEILQNSPGNDMSVGLIDYCTGKYSNPMNGSYGAKKWIFKNSINVISLEIRYCSVVFEKC